MIGCQILHNYDRIFASYFYHNTTQRNVRLPILEGESIVYDVTSIKKNLKNHTFRGYSWDYVAKYVEYFRAIDGWQNEYHPHHFRNILNNIQIEIKNERHFVR